MTYANDITGLCEDAAQKFLRAAGLTRITPKNIFTGLDDETLALPRVVCLCQNGKRILEQSGVWDCDLKIIVRTNSDDTLRPEHRQIAGEVFAAFAGDREGTADALSSFGGFVADDILMVEQSWDQVKGDNNRSWRSIMQYTVKCRAGAA